METKHAHVGLRVAELLSQPAAWSLRSIASGSRPVPDLARPVPAELTPVERLLQSSSWRACTQSSDSVPSDNKWAFGWPEDQRFISSQYSPNSLSPAMPASVACARFSTRSLAEIERMVNQMLEQNWDQLP